MIEFLRMLIPLLIVLTVIYAGLSLYSRSRRKAKLEREWEEGPRDTDRETFIEEGLVAYGDSLRRKMILLVYIVPLALIALMVYLTNYR